MVSHNHTHILIHLFAIRKKGALNYLFIYVIFNLNCSKNTHAQLLQNLLKVINNNIYFLFAVVDDKTLLRSLIIFFI